MKTLKLFGIIAVTALIVFGMTACGDPEPKYLDGQFQLRASSYGPYTGKVLTANYEDDVKFEWYLSGDVVYTTAEDIVSKYTPTVAGTYTVRISAEGYEYEEKAIIVETAPAYVNYLGKWTMKWDSTNPDNSKWANDKTNGGEFNEYLEITKDHYKLTSDKRSTKGSGGLYTVVDPPDGEQEYFDYGITEWTATTTGAPAWASGYSAGYTIKGALVSEHGGYTVADTGFTIFLDSTAKLQVSNRGTANAPQRYYERDGELW